MKQEKMPPQSRVLGLAAKWLAGAALLGVLFIQAASSSQGASTTTPAPLAVAPTCTLATVCITDEVTGDHLSYTCPAGTYTYKRCSTGFTLTGTGVVNTVNGVETLTDSKPDRRINAGLLVGPGTGKAVIYFIPAPGIIQTLTINQTTPFKACGTC